MAEAFKCPSCAAPLEYPGTGAPTMQCPYCHSTVLLPGQSGGSAADVSDIFGGNAADITKIIELARSGNKIAAIKAFREFHGANLETAKEAVENLTAGRPPGNFANHPIRPIETGSRHSNLAVKIVVSIVIFVAAMLTRFSLFPPAHKPSHTAASVPKWVPSLPPFATAPPAAPEFATQVLEFGSEGIGAGQFKDSRSIAVDGDGRIYVGEYSDGRVQVFDREGKFLAEWSIGPKLSLMNLAVDRHGTAYIVVPSHILRFDGLTGEPKGETDVPDLQSGEYYMDAFIALNGNLYALTGNSHLITLGPDGHIKNDIDLAEKVGETLMLNKVAVLPTGEIFAIDRLKGVFKFAPDGRYINRFGGGSENADVSDISAPGHLNDPLNIAVDGKGRVYISNSGPAVEVFNSEGQFIDSFGGSDVVFGITIDDQNNIYACFRNKHAIRKFVPAKL